jgi:hypothetical protein
MMSSLVIPKKKDGKVWNETIPFNPTLFGWDFVKACCCEADFVRGEMKMKVAKQKDRLRVFDKDKKEILTYRMPQSQMEFFILQNTL